MSGIGQSEEGVASTSGMMETSMMEGEEYYNPGDTSTWTQKEMSEQLCRICSKPNQYLIPIFEGEGIEHQLESKIQKHLPIEVLETDELPLQVCYQCASTLIAWNDLVIACIEADKKLRQLFQHHEDQDDKGAEFFDEPILDSDEGEEPTHQSTSPATVISDSQTEILSTKRSPGKAKKSKLQTALLKSSTAGPSGHKPLSKKTVVSSQDDAVQEGTERYWPGNIDLSNKTSRLLFVKTEIGFLCCVECGLTFSLKNELANHLSVEHRKSVFHCDLCDDLFEATKAEFIDHINTHVEGISNVDSSESSLTEKSPRERYQPCTVCGKMFARKFDLKRHMKVHMSDRVHACSLCLKAFSTRYHLVAHRKTHVPENLLSGSKEEGFPCPICGRVLTRKYDLRRHIITTHKSDPEEQNQDMLLENKTVEKVYPCSICRRSFTRHYDMLRHRKLHEVCEENYTGLQLEDGDHLLKHTQLPQPPLVKHFDVEVVNRARFVVNGSERFHCEQCNQIIIRRYNFIRHLRIHTGEKPFTCHVCGKQFRTSLQLNRHFKDVHLGIKNYMCDICYKTFSNSSARNDHRFIHFEKRSFICHICGKAFKTRSCLNVHSRFHKDTIKHECPHCDKKFRTVQNLTSHVRVHTGEKPFSCSICGKTFRTTSQLKNHILIHTTTTASYRCTICLKSFALERYLRNHTRQNHRTVTIDTTDSQVE